MSSTNQISKCTECKLTGYNTRGHRVCMVLDCGTLGKNVLDLTPCDKFESRVVIEPPTVSDVSDDAETCEQTTHVTPGHQRVAPTRGQAITDLAERIYLGMLERNPSKSPASLADKAHVAAMVFYAEMDTRRG